MTSLKTWIHGIAPIIGLSPGALYERQRSLVKLGLLTVTPGRGPGSGVLLTAENAAAVIISALAAEGLSEVDQRVVALCGALPDGTPSPAIRAHGKPTFRSEVARILSGQPTALHYRHVRGIRVSRRGGRGQIMSGASGVTSTDFFVGVRDRYASHRQIRVTAEIEEEMLRDLIDYTQGALSQAAEIEEEGEQ